MNENDNGVHESFGWVVLGFFIPIVGLVLFVIWYNKNRKAAKQAGIGALVRVILNIIFVIFLFFFFFLFTSKGVKGNCVTLGLDGKETSGKGIHVCCDDNGECDIRSDYEEAEYVEKTHIYLDVNGRKLVVELENNSSVDALLERLNKGELLIQAHDYGSFEKVGTIDYKFPTNDESFEAVPGDLILFEGNKISLYYGNNSYSFTKLGHIEISEDELKDLLGSGDVIFMLERMN